MIPWFALSFCMLFYIFFHVKQSVDFHKKNLSSSVHIIFWFCFVCIYKWFIIITICPSSFRFCFVCIDNWATITNLCPLCQKEFQLITCVPVSYTFLRSKLYLLLTFLALLQAFAVTYYFISSLEV